MVPVTWLLYTIKQSLAEFISMDVVTRRLQALARSFTSYSIAKRAMSSESQKPIALYTAPTPNGFKISTFLEELRGQYGGPDYE